MSRFRFVRPPDKRRDLHASFYSIGGKTIKKMKDRGKIKVYTFASLDGFVSKMGGDLDWLLDYPRPAKGDYGYGSFLDSVGCVVMTGMFYTMLQAQDLWPFDSKPCRIVCSKSFHTDPGHNVEFIIDRPEREAGFIESILSLREELGGDVWLLGDHSLTTPFLVRGLIDEITVNLVPRSLGNGQRLFALHGKEWDWTAVPVKHYDNGVIQLRYTV